MTAILGLSAVDKTYPSSPPVRSLHGINLLIDDGDIVAITGPSGSGKTTLMHIMATLERPTEGDVTIAGRSTTSLNDNELAGLRAHHIGVIFQRFFLLDALSALENVATGLLYHGRRAKDRRKAAEVALTRVGLAHRVDHRPNQLSGGEQQRVAIARAIVGNPRVLLADEPTGNLDRQSATEIVDILIGLQRDDTALVVITHDETVAERMPRRVELCDGHIVHDAARSK